MLLHLFSKFVYFTGGLELNATQLLRMAEVTSNDAAIDVMLGAHQSMGLKVFLHGFCSELWPWNF